MSIPRITELAVMEQMIVRTPPDPPGKPIAPGNAVWDLTSAADSPDQSLAIWQCDQPLRPHRCQSDMWYYCISGSGLIIVEGSNGLRDMAGYYLGEGTDVAIPAMRWCLSIPTPSFTAHILNQPAFEPHHFMEMDTANSLDFEVIDYFNSACSQLGWPELADVP